MGGNALGTQAARLPLPEYDALLVHLRATLGDYFDAIEVARYLTTKTSHGDIDALVGWAGATWRPAKGRAEGVVAPSSGGNAAAAGAVADETAVTGSHSQTPSDEPILAPIDAPHPQSASLTSTLTAAGLHSTTLTSPPAQLDAWCAAVAAACGGTHWMRSGHELSVAVPVGVIGAAPSARGASEANEGAEVVKKVEANEGAEVTKLVEANDGAEDTKPIAAIQGVEATKPVDAVDPAVPPAATPSATSYTAPVPHTFYQVDLMLLPPAGVPFQQWTYAYGVNVLLLSQLVRAASGCRGFVMHGHCAVLRCAPYPGLARLDVHLAHDAADVCGYLGLDYDLWNRTHATSLDDVFEWFTHCAPTSRAARGLRYIARYGRAPNPSKPPGGRMAVLDQFGTYLRDHGWEPVPDEPRKGESDAPAPGHHRAPAHPEHPVPLPPTYAALLQYWDKEDEYARALESLRPAATQLWDAHCRRAAAATSEKTTAWCGIM